MMENFDNNEFATCNFSSPCHGLKLPVKAVMCQCAMHRGKRVHLPVDTAARPNEACVTLTLSRICSYPLLRGLIASNVTVSMIASELYDRMMWPSQGLVLAQEGMRFQLST